MQVYKTFLKIIKRNSAGAMIYLGIFVLIAIVMTFSYSENDVTGFEMSQVKVAFINNDKDTELTKAIFNVLKDGNEVIDVDNNTEAIQDALFFREVEYVVIIPKGFSDNFLKGKDVKIGQTSVPDSNSSKYVEMKLNSFLNSVSLYSKFIDIDKISFNDIAESTKTSNVNVDIISNNSNENHKPTVYYYFTTAAYIITAIILYSISSFIMKFNKEEVRNRTICSPIPKIKINFQVIIALILCDIVIFTLLGLMSAILYSNEFFNINGLLYLINLFIYSIFCVSLAYLVGNVTKGASALSGIVNTLALSFSFLSGAFVPQELLGDSVKFVGSFTPTFWYIKSTDLISTITSLTSENISSLIYNSLIMIGFTIAILLIGLIITKQRKNNT